VTSSEAQEAPNDRGPGDAPLVTAVVLAAGRARRFGGTKLLAELDGRPLLTHVLDAVASADVRDAVVVVSSRSDERDTDGGVRALLAARAGAPQLSIVDNPDSAQGMSTSLRVGLEAAVQLDERAGRIAVVLLADQPGVDPGVVRGVVRACSAAQRPARAVYRDGSGPPVALPLALVPSLMPLLTGDRGLRDLLEELDVIGVVVETPMPRDVDRPEDLEALQQR
jgi:molybdenum cofactor cytidylyltransferase